MQSLFANSLLFAAWGVAVASITFPAVYAPDGVLLKSAGQFAGLSIDLSGGEVALLGKCILALSLTLLAASPFMIVARASSRSGLPLVLAIPILLIWPTPYLVLFDVDGWRRGIGLTCLQLAATAAFAAVSARPRRGRLIWATPARVAALRFLIVILGASGGVGFAVGISAVVGTLAGQDHFHHNDIAASLFTLAFDAALIVAGLIVGVTFALRLVSEIDSTEPASRS